MHIFILCINIMNAKILYTFYIESIKIYMNECKNSIYILYRKYKNLYE